MIIISLYLVKEGLSFLQLFLELPETIWGLRKALYTKKSPKITKPINTHMSGQFFARYKAPYIAEVTNPNTPPDWVNGFFDFFNYINDF